MGLQFQVGQWVKHRSFIKHEIHQLWKPSQDNFKVYTVYVYIYIYIYLYYIIYIEPKCPCFDWKRTFLEGSNPRIEDKQVPGTFTHAYFSFLRVSLWNGTGTLADVSRWSINGCFHAPFWVEKKQQLCKVIIDASRTGRLCSGKGVGCRSQMSFLEDRDINRTKIFKQDYPITPSEDHMRLREMSTNGGRSL